MQIPPELFEMSESDLYVELGAVLSGGHTAPADPEQTKREGYHYFHDSLPKIRSLVCESDLIKSFAKEGDLYGFAAAIGDLILAYFKLPAAAATLTVLSVKMGLKSLCPNLKD